MTVISTVQDNTGLWSAQYKTRQDCDQYSTREHRTVIGTAQDETGLWSFQYTTTQNCDHYSTRRHRTVIITVQDGTELWSVQHKTTQDCDHCSTRRHRSVIITVRDNTGLWSVQYKTTPDRDKYKPTEDSRWAVIRTAQDVPRNPAGLNAMQFSRLNGSAPVDLIVHARVPVRLWLIDTGLGQRPYLEWALPRQLPAHY